MQKNGQNQVYVGNIYSKATDEQVKQLLESVGPLVSLLPRRHDVKFSAIAEYFDPQTALVAVQKLNGYKFLNRVLKVKIYGPLTPYYTGIPDPSSQYPMIEQLEKDINIEEFFNELSNEKKLTVLFELRLLFCQSNQQQKLFTILQKKPAITKMLFQALQDLNLLQIPRGQFDYPVGGY